MEKWLLGYIVILAAIVWFTRRMKLWLHNGKIVRPEDNPCQHHLQTPQRWTQDGWVSTCISCKEWIYHGDDYDAGRN